MADVLGKKISELAETTDLAGLYTIGSDRNNQSKKVPLQFVKEAADYANAQGDYAKGVGDTIQGNTGVNEYPAFSSSTQYAAGSVVRYNNKLYRFTALHPAGAWVGTDAIETSIKAETDVKLTDLESDVRGILGEEYSTDTILSWENRAIQAGFYLTVNDQYRLSPIIKVKKGDTFEIFATGEKPLWAVVECDSVGLPTSGLVRFGGTFGVNEKYIFTAEKDMLIRISICINTEGYYITCLGALSELETDIKEYVDAKVAEIDADIESDVRGILGEEYSTDTILSWETRAIQAGFYLTVNDQYRLSPIIKVKKGDTFEIFATGEKPLWAVVECDSVGLPTSGLVRFGGTFGVNEKYIFTAEKDMLIRISICINTEGYYITYLGALGKLETDIKDFVAEIDAEVAELEERCSNISDAFIDKRLSHTLTAVAEQKYYNYIYFNFKAGMELKVEYMGDEISDFLAVSDDEENILASLKRGESKYITLAKDTTYLSLNRAGAFITSSGEATFNIFLWKPAENGIYLYPFRAIANKSVFIYKDAVFVGLKPLLNYEVRPPMSGGQIDNYSKKCLRFNQSAGVYPITVEVENTDGAIMSKKVDVTVRDMPKEKLSNVDSLDVFFFGDSIINQNKNKIGEEFRRMLSTNDGGRTNEDGSILLPALNVCSGKINLIGELQNNTNHWQFLYKLAQVFTDKRDIQYGEVEDSAYWFTHNPFYNLNSSEPDEIGEDGFNKRVDFGWYFENACGKGKYPKLMYIAIGANDYWNGGWDVSIAPSLAEKMVALCKKIKEGCDKIAGGESGIKIKFFNHQTYPLTSAVTLPFPIERARRVQLACYDAYYNAITNPDNGISGYVEFVDCGSKFDWINGYDKELISTNVRCTAKDDTYILETIHMNPVGAYNYADCLIDDFLADPDFD